MSLRDDFFYARNTIKNVRSLFPRRPFFIDYSFALFFVAFVGSVKFEKLGMATSDFYGNEVGNPFPTEYSENMEYDSIGVLLSGKISKTKKLSLDMSTGLGFVCFSKWFGSTFKNLQLLAPKKHVSKKWKKSVDYLQVLSPKIRASKNWKKPFNFRNKFDKPKKKSDKVRKEYYKIICFLDLMLHYSSKIWTWKIKK